VLICHNSRTEKGRASGAAGPALRRRTYRVLVLKYAYLGFLLGHQDDHFWVREIMYMIDGA
jgi:hypothetical protein